MTPPDAPQMTITDFNYEISYLPGLTCHMDVRVQIGRSTGSSTPQVLESSGQEWQFYISTVRVHIGRLTGRSTPQYWHPVVKNGNFTFLLLEFILADQLADLPTSRSASRSEWQFEIFHVRAHMGRSSGRWMLEVILADQVADLPPLP